MSGRSSLQLLRIFEDALRARDRPQALFGSAAHKEAVARLSWCIDEHGLAVVTGEVGCGKTAAARATVAALDPSRTQVIYCPNPNHRRAGDPLPRRRRPRRRATLSPLGARPSSRRGARCGRSRAGTARARHLRREPSLRRRAARDLRMITNAEMDSRSPAALVLIGQPTLRRRLHQAALAALDQRVSLRVHMEGMELSETIAYLRHHLALTGRSDVLSATTPRRSSTTRAAGFPGR